jgi:hypothetical protein
MNDEKITNVLTMIINKMDNLEEEQVKSNEALSKVKSRLLQLNGFVNDIIDVIENDFHYEDEKPITDKISKFRHLSEAIMKELNVDSKDVNKKHLKSVLNEIIGES